MSQKLIAGAGVAASFAIALAPLATFATPAYDLANGQQVDTLKVTIEEVCALGHDYTGSTANVAAGTHTKGNAGAVTNHGTIKHADNTTYAGVGAGTWSSADVTGADTLYGVLENSTVTTDFGKTTLKVVCNDVDGYTLKATGTPLKRNDQDADPIAHSVEQGYFDGSSTTNSAWAFQVSVTATGGAAVATGYDGWSAALEQATISNATGKVTTSGGDAWTITYGVAIDAAQPADTYTGTMTYVLASID